MPNYWCATGSLDSRRPVDHRDHRRRGDGVRKRVHQEFFSVGAGRVRMVLDTDRPYRRHATLEERARALRLKPGSGGDGHGHQLQILRQIEQLLAVAPPAWLIA